MNPALMNKGLGDWEKHTKGIGAKLLLGVIYTFTKNLSIDLTIM